MSSVSAYDFHQVSALEKETCGSLLWPASDSGSLPEH
jgi:hypothetical protein